MLFLFPVQINLKHVKVHPDFIKKRFCKNALYLYNDSVHQPDLRKTTLIYTTLYKTISVIELEQY